MNGFDFYVKIPQLRVYASELEQDGYTAQKLYARLEKAKYLSDDSFRQRYVQLLEKTDRLAHLFSALAAVAEEASDDAELSIRQIRSKIVDDCEYIRRLTDRDL